MGDPLTIQRLGADGIWEDWMNLHALRVNPYSSRENEDDGGEQAWTTIDFTVRWCRRLEEVQFSRPSFRIVWKGHHFDIRRYDDYMNNHKSVKLTGVSRG